MAEDYVAELRLDRQRRRARHLQRQLAFYQLHAAVLHIHIDGTGGIELQGTAIGELHLFALASGGVQVGTPDVQRQLSTDQPGRRHQRHGAQCALQHCASARIRAVQAAQRQRRRQIGETLTQGLGLLPGLLVTGAGVAPTLQVRAVLLIGATRFEQRKPLCRSPDGLTGIG
ncbi:hypothetical protein D3C84_663910 [compost metagenome]